MSSSNAATYYEVLGIPQTSDQATIRKAYLKASLRCHPDKNVGREEEAKEEFIQVGQAYSVLKDETSRRAYDYELAAGKASSWRPQRPHRPSAKEQAAQDKEFNSFMDLFDDTVSGMSEAELNMAMGAAAVVGSIIGSIMGARAGKGNSLLSSAASMVGSAMASQAASTLVKTVHEDSTQRAIEKNDRAERIARGESIPESTPKDNRERLIRDAGAAFSKVVGAAVGMGRNEQGNESSYTFSTSNNKRNSGSGSINWRQAAKMASMAAKASQRN